MKELTMLKCCSRHRAMLKRAISMSVRRKANKSVAETREMDLDTRTAVDKDIGKHLTLDVDPSTVKQVYYFDTLGLVKTLSTKGFTRQQAEGLTESLIDLVNTTLEYQGRHTISTSQHELTRQHFISEITLVKKDMVLLQKCEFASLRNEIEKQSVEIRQVRDYVRDEILKLQSHMRLDINLERSRAVEAHAENEKQLTKLYQKIETDDANLRTRYEIYRNDVFKYAGGTVLTCAGLCLGLIRLWS